MKTNSKFVAILVVLLLAALFTLGACGGKHTAIFDTKGGTEVDPVVFRGGGKIEPPVTTKQYFTFDNWYADEALTTPFDFRRMPNSDVTVYAGWLPAESGKIVFDSNGGSAESELVGTVGDTVRQDMLPVPEKEGYSFEGWYTEDGQPYVSGPFASGVLTLYARWGKSNGYNYVKFVLDDATEIPVPAGEKVAEPFVGEDISCTWYINEQTTVPFDFDSVVDSDVTLYGIRESVGLVYGGGSVIDYTGDGKQIFVPSKHGGTTIVAIGDGVFEGAELEQVFLPQSVASIGSYAFYKCSHLSAIDLSNVSVLGKFAFGGCERLDGNADISLLATVPEGAFANCQQLDSVQFGSQLTEIGSDAFVNCSSLTEVDIPDGVTTIYPYAFANSGVKKVHIPAALNTLGKAVFKGCTNISEMTGGNANYAVDGDNGTLTDGNKLVLHFKTEVNKNEDSYTPSGRISSIESYAFWGDTVIKNLDLSGKNIAASALEGMKALTELTVSDIDNSYPFVAYWFGAGSPERNTSTGLYVPATLQRIVFTNYSLSRVADYAFYGCNGLKSVSGLDNVASIGKYAFGYTAFTSFELGGRVTSVDSAAFHGAADLAEFSVAPSNSAYSVYDGALYNKSQTELVFVPSAKTDLNFAPTVSSIKSGALYKSSVSVLTVPNSVSRIEFGAFEGMSKLTELTVPFVGGSRTSNNYMLYVFGATVTSGANDNINVSAEKCPPLLKRIVVSGGLTEIPRNAFAYCTSVSEFDVGNDYTSVGSAAFFNTSLTEAIIPDTVKTIGNYAYYDSDNIKSVVIGSGVTSIGDLAFAVIADLESIVFKGGSNDLTIGSAAFLAESSTDSSTGNQTLGSKVSRLVLSDNIVEIGQSAFTYVGVNGTLAADGDDDIQYNFIELTFDAANSRLKKIGTSAFGISAITKLALPASVREIGLIAFAGCEYLSEVTIGSPQHEAVALQTITGGSFAENPRLRSFTVYKHASSAADVPVLHPGSGILFDSYRNDAYPNGIGVFSLTSAQIYVPADSVEAYKAAWNSGLNRLADYILPIEED